MASFLTSAFRRGGSSSNQAEAAANQEAEMHSLIRKLAETGGKDHTQRKQELMRAVTRGCEKVIKLCAGQGLNLKNSPPFILDILPEMHLQLFNITSTHYSKENLHYLTIFMENLTHKCDETIKLFKSSGIMNPESEERRSLTKLSLTFSHMLFELKSMYTAEDGYIGETFRITKKEPEEFWKRSFRGAILVPWTEFINALKLQVAPLIKFDAQHLQKTIDLTGNGYVSIFEWDVFTRLFFPWRSILQNWEMLTTNHPGYMAFMTYDEVKKKLQQMANRPGSYVFRLSCTRPGQWAIGYVAPDGKIYQTIPQNKSLLQALMEGEREGFYLYPNGRDCNVDVRSFLRHPDHEVLKVTKAEYEEYSSIGTTFEVCKICDDNEKDRVLEPCGHMLCIGCLTKWQDTEGGTKCPYCRCEIKGTNKVVIEKYVPPAKKEECKENGPRELPPLPMAPPPLPPRRNALHTKKSNPMDHTYVNITETSHEAMRNSQPPETMAPLPPVEPTPSSSRIELDYMNIER